MPLHYYYCVGTLAPNGPQHTPKLKNGDLAFDKLFGSDTATLNTTTIKIVRAIKKGVPPKIRGGGGRGGG